jgi:hypothetical protein
MALLTTSPWSDKVAPFVFHLAEAFTPQYPTVEYVCKLRSWNHAGISSRSTGPRGGCRVLTLQRFRSLWTTISIVRRGFRLDADLSWLLHPLRVRRLHL